VTTKRKWLGWVWVMAVVAGLGSAQALVLHGIPGGDFSDPFFANGKPQEIPTEGLWRWDYYEVAATAANVVGTGADRHGEVTLDWGWRGSSIWYVDSTSTPLNQAWTISADLQGTLGYFSEKSPGRWFGLMDGDQNSNWVAYLNFCPDKTVEWYTPTASGTFTSTTGIDDGVYHTVSFQYDPATGAMKATLGLETIFDVVTSPALSVRTLFFMNYAPSQGTGTFMLDNVTATGAAQAIPGDANNDGKVDVSDLGILAANYGMTAGATWELGDFNNDGKVDVSDLGILAANYGTGSGSALDFNRDAAAYGLVVDDEAAAKEAPATSTLGCQTAGLPLIAGLLLAGLLLVKWEE